MGAVAAAGSVLGAARALAMAPHVLRAVRSAPGLARAVNEPSGGPMKTSLRTRGLDGLAQRLAARYLPPAAADASARAAADLAETITAETGVSAETPVQPGAARVRLADPALLAARRGGPDMPGDPILDRILLDFARRRR